MTDDQRVSFGLIGCGSVAPYHVHAFQKSSLARLALVADADAEIARRFGERFGVSAARTVDELLSFTGIQAVSIATPPGTLATLGAQAARAGKHVLAEKPLASTVEEARALIETCRNAGIKLSVWLERRYQPFAVKARELIQNGTLGPIFLITVNTLVYKTASYWNYGFRNEGPSTDWRRSRTLSGGGVLLINTIHQLDLAAFISGLRVVDVFARTIGGAGEVENVALASLRCSRGELINVTASSSAFGLGNFPVYASRDILVGAEGSLILSTPLELKHRVIGTKSFELPLLDLVDSKALAVDDFAKVILEGREPPISPMDALKALTVVKAAYRSAETGERVLLGEED